MNKIIVLLCLGLTLSGCKKNVEKKIEVPEETEEVTEEVSQQKKDHQLIEVKKTLEPITIDGVANETIWQNTSWHPIDQLWLGKEYDATDFSGKYKLTWDKSALYILVEIQDDTLYDQNKDPLTLWWDDDCVEIFVDEDNSGGEHQYNHNAFAYHIALDGNVVDIAPGETPKLYNNHVKSKRQTRGNTSIWEFNMSLYDNTYKDDGNNTSVKLNTNKKIGFAIAYCDNDSSAQRENFIGSVRVEGDDKNRGWIDANIFGTLVLAD
mgnify:CR=1 FL=1|jgi:hypothetical protein